MELLKEESQTEEKKPEIKIDLNLFVSGLSEEDLLKKQVKINGELFEIPRMKTRQIVEVMGQLKGVDWDNFTYEELLSRGMLMLPYLTGIDSEKVLDVELEDWEVILVHFKKNNPYFIKIFRRSGFQARLQAILAAFGVEVQKT